MPLHHLLQDVCTPVNSVLHRGFMRGGARVTESDPVNHTNHGERQKSLSPTDLLSHNNVDLKIFK